MPLKNLSDKPTSVYDYAWSNYKSYTRSEFTAMYPLGTSSVASIIGEAIAGSLPKYGWLVGIADALSALTSSKKDEMVNGIYTSLVNNTNYDGVRIGSKFSGHRKGSQGWFWLPANDYRVQYF